MPKYLDYPCSKLFYEVCERFVGACLKSDDSLFTPGRPVWAKDVIEDLYERFVDNPDEGSDTFIEKLERQLDSAPPSTVQLMAEVVFIHAFPVISERFTPEKKQELIEKILKISKEPVALSEQILSWLKCGVVGAGIGYNTSRPFGLSFILDLAKHMKALSHEERESLLSDPWKFRSEAERLMQKGAKPQFHMMMHVIHPDTFEPIASLSVKKQIVSAFKEYVEDEKLNIDRQLEFLRHKLVEAGHKPFGGFYDPHIYELWRDHDVNAAKGERNTYEVTGSHEGRSFTFTRRARNAPDFAIVVVDANDGEIKLWGWTSSRKRFTRHLQKLEAQDEYSHVYSFERDRGEIRTQGGSIPSIIGPPPDDGKPSLPKNLILYGPPGTGKTYRVAELAAEICGFALPASDAPDRRETIMQQYRKLLDDERIKFVTFHQSFGYEEFVEGLRPMVEREGDDCSLQGGLQYRVVDGVFKSLCDVARAWTGSAEASVDIDPSSSTFWKMSLGNTQRSDDDDFFDECVSNGVIRLGWGHGLDFTGCSSRDEIAKRLRENDVPADFSVTAVNLFKNEMAIGDFVIVSEGNSKVRAIGRVTGEYEGPKQGDNGHYRKTEWLFLPDESIPREVLLRKNLSQMTIYKLSNSNVKLDAIAKYLKGSDSGEPENHVLIIDEINRANISKVFGELITLLEPDKRLGEINEITVSLPYSQKKFGVPPNLYVIGTMNTADRSIALLDTALRRRFEFWEMLPDEAVIRDYVGEDGVIGRVDVAGLFDVMNKRIELLYDRDHQIGHSFFLGIKTLEDLKDVFIGRIIPLLREYFYGDDSKISAVFGNPLNVDLSPAERRESTHILVPKNFDDKIASKVWMGGFENEQAALEINPRFVKAKKEQLEPFFLSIGGQAVEDE